VKPIISVKEARKILGKDAETMADREIEEVVNTLDLLAKDALQEAKRRN
jgi:vacuolar-type H+-ATPase subunit H